MSQIQSIKIKLEKEDYQTLEKIGELKNRKNEDIAKAMLKTMINWVGKEIIERIEKEEAEKNNTNQKKQTNSFPQSINFQKIPKNTNPSDVILHGTIYLRFAAGYGEMCLDSCRHFPKNSIKCKKCILNGLNDTYALETLLGYDLTISEKD